MVTLLIAVLLYQSLTTYIAVYPYRTPPPRHNTVLNHTISPPPLCACPNTVTFD